MGDVEYCRTLLNVVNAPRLLEFSVLQRSSCGAIFAGGDGFTAFDSKSGMLIGLLSVFD